MAGVLTAMADLMHELQTNDLALQNALSSLAAQANSSPEMVDLQHVDILTQTHGDLASLLPTLASALAGETVDKADLRSSLSLRSLQDALLDKTSRTEDEHSPGELSLF